MLDSSLSWMELMKNLTFCAFVIACCFFVPDCDVHAQFSQGASPSRMADNSSAQKAEKQKPWAIASRIHLEKGTNKGYLVVQVDLAEGYHMYSLNPKGSPSPTKLTISKSDNLRVLSEFASEKPPVVVKNDPVFNQRMEKHKGKVQFFASIEVRPGIDLEKLTQQVQFSGQICSDQACQPIRNHKAKASFAGYFELPKTRNAAANRPLK